MSNTERPLSPHLSIYRWPITMALSILHRITGVAMSVGLVVLVLWLSYLNAGPEAYQYFRLALSTVAGQLILVSVSFAFFLHLGNGIRHLVWDTGRGLGKLQSRVSAWFVLLFAIVLTAVFWMIIA
jgi:succinate dehydrogenase / fumarate reductase cytochrome b subunit